MRIGEKTKEFKEEKNPEFKQMNREKGSVFVGQNKMNGIVFGRVSFKWIKMAENQFDFSVKNYKRDNKK